MRYPLACVRLLSTVGSLALLSGCNPTGTTIGGSGTGISWLTGVGENLVPGLDSGSLHHEKAGNTDVLVVWIDNSQVTSSSSTSSGFGTTHSGKFFFRGRTSGTPDLEWHSNDRGSGTVTCGKIEYDLKNGILFLVATTGPEPVVKQLKRDVSNLKATREGIREFADGDDELREFFTRLAPAKTNAQLHAEAEPETDAPQATPDAGEAE